MKSCSECHTAALPLSICASMPIPLRTNSSQICRWIFYEHEIGQMELQRDQIHGEMG